VEFGEAYPHCRLLPAPAIFGLPEIFFRQWQKFRKNATKTFTYPL
jgi:hypothetical protein